VGKCDGEKYRGRDQNGFHQVVERPTWEVACRGFQPVGGGGGWAPAHVTTERAVTSRPSSKGSTLPTGVGPTGGVAW
jgi:hypothetical protein